MAIRCEQSRHSLVHHDDGSHGCVVPRLLKRTVQRSLPGRHRGTADRAVPSQTPPQLGARRARRHRIDDALQQRAGPSRVGCLEALFSGQDDASLPVLWSGQWARGGIRQLGSSVMRNQPALAASRRAGSSPRVCSPTVFVRAFSPEGKMTGPRLRAAHHDGQSAVSGTSIGRARILRDHRSHQRVNESDGAVGHGQQPGPNAYFEISVGRGRVAAAAQMTGSTGSVESELTRSTSRVRAGRTVTRPSISRRSESGMRPDRYQQAALAAWSRQLQRRRADFLLIRRVSAADGPASGGFS